MWPEHIFNTAVEKLQKSKKVNEEKINKVKEQIMLRHVRDKRKDQLQRSFFAFSWLVVEVGMEENQVLSQDLLISFLSELNPKSKFILNDIWKLIQRLQLFVVNRSH